jgi:hypothetical protein
MSEAVNPNSTNPNSTSEILPTTDARDAAEQVIHAAIRASGIDHPQPSPAVQGGDDWQTVDFPDALSIDAILHADPATVPFPEKLPANPDKPEAITQKAPADVDGHLKVENAQLQAQIRQLEQDLAQMQVDFQLESARFFCKEPIEERENSAIAQTQAKLAVAEAQIQHLSQELATSKTSAQQQQILVVTLTEQLQESQSRIAQLERECAISQQRYNEQFQLTLQAENTCRDLRMRLHRQQRQALQFKAALEKSLDVNGTTDAAIAASPAEPEGEAVFIPKAQPVQPWSISPGSAIKPLYPTVSLDAVALPNLLHKLRDADQPTSPQASASEQGLAAATPETQSLDSAPKGASDSAPTQTIAENLAQLFPAIALEPAHHQALDASLESSQDTVFDLSPFVEAGDIDSAQIASAAFQVDQPRDAVQAESAETPKPAKEDTLWADLARLIEPDPAISSSSSSSTPPATPKVVPLNGQPAAQSIRPPAAASASDVLPQVAPQTVEPAAQNTPPWMRSLIVAATQADSAPATPPAPSQSNHADSAAIVSPFITVGDIYAPETPRAPETVLAPSPSGFVETAIAANEGLDDNLELAAVGSPSPVLYPARNLKKIASMSAVDLPSFGRAVN